MTPEAWIAAIGVGVTLLMQGVILSYFYGRLNGQVKDLKEDIDSIREDVKAINDKLWGWRNPKSPSHG
jgi:hypothetical protein